MATPLPSPAGARHNSLAEATEIMPPVRRTYMAVGGVLAPVDDGLAEAEFGYTEYTCLAGPLTRPDPGRPYRVRYRGIHLSRREWLATRLIALVLVALDARFIYWLIFQSQYPPLGGLLWPSNVHLALSDGYILLRGAMALGSILMQLLLLTNVLTVSRACLAARDPVPVEPDPGLRVAFLTTIVPERNWSN